MDIDKALNIIQEEDIINEIDPFSAMVAVSLGALLLAAASVASNYVSTKKRKCARTKGIERQVCETMVEAEGKKKHLSSLNRALSKCNKASDPVNCKEKVSEKIQRVSAEYKEMVKRVQRLKAGTP